MKFKGGLCGYGSLAVTNGDGLLNLLIFIHLNHAHKYGKQATIIILCRSRQMIATNLRYNKSPPYVTSNHYHPKAFTQASKKRRKSPF